MTKVLAFVKRNPVVTVAAVAALITMFLVPPDAQYLGYFDWRTLTCLFCVLAVVCALKNIQFFYLLARKIIEKFKTLRMAVIALVYITFIGSMLIANDMALLTFLPLGYFVLKRTGKEHAMALVFIFQNIAANLGGMLTPFGNLQNLYLYSHFGIPDGEFVMIMLPPFLLSITLITLCCFLIPKDPLQIRGERVALPKGRTAVYMALFTLAIIIVFRGIPYWIGLIIIPLVLLFMDRQALKDVDYGLLCTFVLFFIFSGNLARIPAVQDFFGGLLELNTLLVSVISCQCISNVPTAILLSQFTQNYADLLVGVNIGGVGTLIASLASLITFREYAKHNQGRMLRYVLVFTLFNFLFLIVLCAFQLIFF
ncbi:MAG: citrate transporter [Clostridia bacterium]|nr:citrate transporter [Clostridia bacterium]